MAHISFPKPARGTWRLEIRERRETNKAHEDREMRAAKRRDKGCRWPHCEYQRKRLALHACHLKHRGMGGNPSGDRTTRDQIVTLCSVHHGQFDLDNVRIKPLTRERADGPCVFIQPGHRSIAEIAVGIPEPQVHD